MKQTILETSMRVTCHRSFEFLMTAIGLRLRDVIREYLKAPMLPDNVHSGGAFDIRNTIPDVKEEAK